MEKEQKRTQEGKKKLLAALEVNTTATTFFLRTRGRKRGYNEKQEIDLTSGDERIKININLGD